MRKLVTFLLVLFSSVCFADNGDASSSGNDILKNYQEMSNQAQQQALKEFNESIKKQEDEQENRIGGVHELVPPSRRQVPAPHPYPPYRSQTPYPQYYAPTPYSQTYAPPAHPALVPQTPPTRPVRPSTNPWVKPNPWANKQNPWENKENPWLPPEDRTQPPRATAPQQNPPPSTFIPPVTPQSPPNIYVTPPMNNPPPNSPNLPSKY